jgi:hypothetical protein
MSILLVVIRDDCKGEVGDNITRSMKRNGLPARRGVESGLTRELRPSDATLQLLQTCDYLVHLNSDMH